MLARSALDGCQILRYSPQALSVQFHPEFDHNIMTACLPSGVSDDGAQLSGEDWARELLQRFWANAPAGAGSGRVMPRAAINPGWHIFSTAGAASEVA